MGRLYHIDDVKINTFLTVAEAYAIAQKFHQENGVSGTIPSSLYNAVYLDECHFLTKEVTWMVCSKLEKNTFEGMDRFTIMILDKSKKVFGVLDHNDILIVRNK